MSISSSDAHWVARWRLVLGQAAEEARVTCAGDTHCDRIERLLGFLFIPEAGSETGANGARVTNRATQTPGSRRGGRGASRLTVPLWVDGVSELFPRQAKEVLERELLQRRGLAELLEKPELLERIEPNQQLVKTLLTHRELLNPQTRLLARKIISQVVEQLREKLKTQVHTAITGAIRRDRRSPRRVLRNLDLRTTLRRNLKNFDRNSEKLLVDKLAFFAAERRQRPWQVILAVDQSGSMLDSAIFSAVMASIFAELPAVRTSLFLFDTQIVDLTEQVREPVDVLLSIHLGGGTNILQALQYGQSLIREPARTILVLISDFEEGGDDRGMVRQTGLLAEAGVRMVGLAALGYDARPQYNRTAANKLRRVGMDILVCTPEKLAECMGEIMRGV